MNDLISRSKAKEEIMAWAVRINNPKNLSTEDTMTVLDMLPAVDAVPVVRCRDCKHYERGVCVCPYLCVSGAACLYPQPEHFCSYGERRNGDG